MGYFILVAISAAARKEKADYKAIRANFGTGEYPDNKDGEEKIQNDFNKFCKQYWKTMPACIIDEDWSI